MKRAKRERPRFCLRPRFLDCRVLLPTTSLSSLIVTSNSTPGPQSSHIFYFLLPFLCLLLLSRPRSTSSSFSKAALLLFLAGPEKNSSCCPLLLLLLDSCCFAPISIRERKITKSFPPPPRLRFSGEESGVLRVCTCVRSTHKPGI